MHMMLRWSVPVEKGNEAIKNGSMTRTIETLLEELKPETAYFWAENGKRSGMVVFDMTESSQIPQIVEPLFMGTDAAVAFTPVMNVEDLKQGLEKAAANF